MNCGQNGKMSHDMKHRISDTMVAVWFFGWTSNLSRCRMQTKCSKFNLFSDLMKVKIVINSEAVPCVLFYSPARSTLVFAKRIDVWNKLHRNVSSSCDCASAYRTTLGILHYHVVTVIHAETVWIINFRWILFSLFFIPFPSLYISVLLWNCMLDSN